MNNSFGLTEEFDVQIETAPPSLEIAKLEFTLEGTVNIVHEREGEILSDETGSNLITTSGKQQIAKFVQALGRFFDSARACVVLAGDLSHSGLGQKMGSSHYAHGYRDTGEALLGYLPWARWVKTFSPLERNCTRWKLWQRWLTKIQFLQRRLTPVLVQIRW